MKQWTAKFESDHTNEYSIYFGSRHLMNIHSADSDVVPLVVNKRKHGRRVYFDSSFKTGVKL